MKTTKPISLAALVSNGVFGLQLLSTNSAIGQTISVC
jgi:hypothetical protein